MLTFLTFIGIVLMFVLIGFRFFVGHLNEEDVKATNIYGEDKKKSPGFLLALRSWKTWGIAMGGAFFLALFGNLFFYSIQGNQYYLVYPTGDWTVVSTPGFKWRGFARIQEWQKEIDVKVVADGDPTDGVEGVMKDQTVFTIEKGKDRQQVMVPGVPITFIDRVYAAVRISARMKMPQDPQTFRVLAESFKSQDNLVYNTLIPTIREQLSNVGYQFACQDYISGAATDFRQAIDDQLKSGGYSTQRMEYHDTVYTSIQDAGPRAIKEINTRYKIIRNVDKDGKLIRIPHEITKNGVDVTQVIIDAVQPEPAFQQRLEAQRDISAQKRIEMEKIETAKAEQQRIIAEGERDKSHERVEQEKEQVKALIAIETQLKQESTKKQLAEIALQTEKLTAETRLVKERAEAEANRLKVAAGLTPQERAEWEYKTSVGVAEKIAGPTGLKLPATYIQGQGANSQNSLLETLIGAELAKKMMDK